jgi:hypothetical protein
MQHKIFCARELIKTESQLTLLHGQTTTNNAATTTLQGKTRGC